jgi:hypothetical protein
VLSISDRMVNGSSATELLNDKCGDPAHAVGLAAVMGEGVLVEMGLQVLGVDRAGVCAQEPPLQERDRPVAVLCGALGYSEAVSEASRRRDAGQHFPPPQ